MLSTTHHLIRSSAALVALILFAVLLALTIVPPTSAKGHETTHAKGSQTTASARDVPPAVERALVGGAEHELEPAADGAYVVAPAVGAPLLTHGPDRAAPLAAGSRRGFRVGDPQRQPRCAEDYYQQIVYAAPASQPDRYNQTVEKIRDIVGRMNSVLNRSSRASGGGSADYKVLCDAAGKIEVSKLVTHLGSSFSDIVSSARAAGFDKANVDYTIFADVSPGDSCGVGSQADDESLSEANANNTGGDYGITYRTCWYEDTAMHENGHNQGAVQRGAPHSTGSGSHCWDALDVMCYSPDGGSKHQGGVVTKCPAVHYDCGFNDYFDAAPEPGEYLSKHWNIGSQLNRFISFGDRGGGQRRSGAGA